MRPDRLKMYQKAFREGEGRGREGTNLPSPNPGSAAGHFMFRLNFGLKPIFGFKPWFQTLVLTKDKVTHCHTHIGLLTAR